MITAIIACAVLCGCAEAAEPPGPNEDPNEASVLEFLGGTWVQTSVRIRGEELYGPGGRPSNGNLVIFNGMNLTQCTPSGKPFLRGRIKIVKATTNVWEIDLPDGVVAEGKIKTVTVPAIVGRVGKDGLQIAFYDPESGPPGKRPVLFESTDTNGAVLIQLKRKS